MGAFKGDNGDEDSSNEVLDGRLSAIMPRKLFTDDVAVQTKLLQVFVRIKPVQKALQTCMSLDHSSLLKATWRNKEAVYKFSQVFQQDADQAAVYQGTTYTLVDDLLDFRQPSAVVMAYGVTSAGKTYTMQGSADKPGLVPQALKAIFKGKSSGCQVVLSVCEIYNETVQDLLAAPAARGKPLKLKEDKQGHITVQDMCEVTVNSIKEALEQLRKAAKARQSAETGANERSSRSHAVTTIKLQNGAASVADAAGLQVMQQSCLHFVDLAGCERVKRTGNSGARLRESVAINSSLMTLARCLEVLRYNQQHPADQKVIPYRESKITHMFKDVLRGNGRFVMLVNVSPASDEFNETKRVLEYAALASKVTMTSEVEHTIAGDTSWANAATEHSQPLLPSSTPTAAQDAVAATAMSAALAAANARIEELLDDKADLEYEIDVVEKKVELLRDELINAEVEKEQKEVEVRAEVLAEVQQLVQDAAAAHEAAQEQAKQEASEWRQQVVQLHVQLEQQAGLLQQQERQLQELQAAAEAEKHHSMSVRGQERLLQEAKRAAATAARIEAEAQLTAEISVLGQQHRQQLQQVQQRLQTAEQQFTELQRSQLQLEASAVQQASSATHQLSYMQTVATAAVQLLEQVVTQQWHGAADVQELTAFAERLHAAMHAMQQPPILQQQQRSLQRAEQSQQQQAAVAQEKLAAALSVHQAARLHTLPCHRAAESAATQQQQAPNRRVSLAQLNRTATSAAGCRLPALPKGQPTDAAALEMEAANAPAGITTAASADVIGPVAGNVAPAGAKKRQRASVVVGRTAAGMHNAAAVGNGSAAAAGIKPELPTCGEHTAEAGHVLHAARETAQLLCTAAPAIIDAAVEAVLPAHLPPAHSSAASAPRIGRGRRRHTLCPAAHKPAPGSSEGSGAAAAKSCAGRALLQQANLAGSEERTGLPKLHSICEEDEVVVECKDIAATNKNKGICSPEQLPIGVASNTQLPDAAIIAAKKRRCTMAATVRVQAAAEPWLAAGKGQPNAAIESAEAVQQQLLPKRQCSLPAHEAAQQPDAMHNCTVGAKHRLSKGKHVLHTHMQRSSSKAAGVAAADGAALTACEEHWQQAETVLRDVYQQQLTGRRATIATIHGGKKETVRATAGTLGVTPVAFRTRHRRVRRQ